MCSTYAEWDWKPIPIASGLLFKFPSEGGLTLLTKRDVIPCNNGHFVVSRWKEEREGVPHPFPVRATTLAFNIPSYLRSESEMARMVARFAHLIDACQVLEEGGPMKMILGCRRASDIPKEVPIIFGGKEFRVALAIRETTEERSTHSLKELRGGEQERTTLEFTKNEEGAAKKERDLKLVGESTQERRGGLKKVIGGGDASGMADELSSTAEIEKFPDLGQTDSKGKKGERISTNSAGQKEEERGSLGGTRGGQRDTPTREGVQSQTTSKVFGVDVGQNSNGHNEYKYKCGAHVCISCVSFVWT